MTPATITVRCWRVWGWDRTVLQWTVRSTHDDETDAAEHAEALAHRLKIRTRVQATTRKMVRVSPPPAPTAAQRFREAQADAMVVRRQAFAYYKSGSNGTEIVSLPAPDATPPATTSRSTRSTDD